MSVAGKWGHSPDQETYYGKYDTKEEAMSCGPGWVAQFADPTPPEEFVDADLVIEHVVCQDEYLGDWAEGCFDCGKEAEDELTSELRRVFGVWIDKHGMRPEFGTVKQETVERVGS